jgi:hypothetical protein
LVVDGRHTIYVSKFVEFGRWSPYKGKYYPNTQYLFAKPEKWGIKTWCCTNSNSKYTWTFEVYTGKDVNKVDEEGSKPGNAKQGPDVAQRLKTCLKNCKHIVLKDKFFTSIDLLVHLLAQGICATRTSMQIG